MQLVNSRIGVNRKSVPGILLSVPGMGFLFEHFDRFKKQMDVEMHLFFMYSGNIRTIFCAAIQMVCGEWRGQ